MFYTELADVVGRENVSTSESDKLAYSCDYYWIPSCLSTAACAIPSPT